MPGWAAPHRAGDIWQIGGQEHALPHLVNPFGMLCELQVMRNEDEGERLAPLQLFEERDDVALGVFVQIAGRLVGKQ